MDYQELLCYLESTKKIEKLTKKQKKDLDKIRDAYESIPEKYDSNFFLLSFPLVFATLYVWYNDKIIFFFSGHLQKTAGHNIVKFLVHFIGWGSFILSVAGVIFLFISIYKMFSYKRKSKLMIKRFMISII